MAKPPSSCMELPLDSEVLSEIITKAKDWSMIHGGTMRSRTSEDSVDLTPVTLLPSVVPRTAFEAAVEVQTLINLLTHRIAHDHHFLVDSLERVIETDDFTRRLFEIYQKVRKEGFKQPASLGLFRSDYMEDSGGYYMEGCGGYKQVEMNTVSVCLASLASRFSTLHGYVLKELDRSDLLDRLPPNCALEGMCSAMVEAWKLFGDERSVILFVVEDETYNICDQRMMEYEVREQEPNARVIRRSLTQLVGGAQLTEGDRDLVVDGRYKVAVVYYRSGYDPSQYPTEAEWKVRLEIERSTAIKCPSIQYHLAGTKKIQQVLARKGVVERFIKDPEDVKAIRDMFTDLYPLDFDEEGDEAMRLGLSDPTSFVLKPQREGGGNNIYGENVGPALSALGEDRPGWILMRRLRPRETSNYLLRKGAAEARPVRLVSELGIFGAILGSANDVVLNKQCGHTLRSKTPDTDEGGVAAGFAALDSPFLV